MKCYGLGLGLNTFKMVALTEHFRKLELPHLLNAYTRHAHNAEPDTIACRLPTVFDHDVLFYSSTFAASCVKTALYVQVGEAAVPAGLRRHAAAPVQHLHQTRQGGEYHFSAPHLGERSCPQPGLLQCFSQQPIFLHLRPKPRLP